MKPIQGATGEARGAPQGGRTRLLLFCLLLPISLVCTAAWSASHALGRGYPSAMIGADGCLAIGHYSIWGALPQITHGDCVIAVEDVAVPARAGAAPGRQIRAHLSALQRVGRDAVRITVSHRGAKVTRVLALRTIGWVEILSGFVVYALSGAIFLWSGVLCGLLSRWHIAARAYLLFCVGVFGTLVTMFDYHTGGLLSPYFPPAVITISVGLLWMAYAFPYPARRSRLLLKALYLATGAGVMCALWSIACFALPRDLRPLRALINGSGLLSAVIAIAWVSIRPLALVGTGLRPLLLWLLVILHSLVFLISVATGSRLAVALNPLIILLVPLGVELALIRYDILNTKAVLSWRLILVPLCLWSLLAGSVVCLVVSLLLQRGADTIVAALCGLLGTITALLIGHRVLSYVIFPASERFRPIVSRLTGLMITLRTTDALRHALEQEIRSSMGIPGARVLTPEDLATQPDLPAGAGAQLQGGERIMTTGEEQHLMCPMLTGGVMLGVLRVPGRQPGTLFTSDDLVLLDTLASLGALALYHAQAVEQIQALRRAESEAAQDDKRLTLDLVSAEVGHEVALPLSYFRCLLKLLQDAQPVSARDVAIGSEELDRLERMIAKLRRVEAPPLRREPVVLAQPVSRALTLVREALQQQSITAAVVVPAGLVVEGDLDALVQVFTNLARNATQAAGAGGQIGVRAWAEESETVVEVWDKGPGVPAELAGRIFQPWVTTRPEGLGIGLCITSRIVRGLGGRIRFHRDGDTTVFQLCLPRRASALSEGAPPAPAAAGVPR